MFSGGLHGCFQVSHDLHETVQVEGSDCLGSLPLEFLLEAAQQFGQVEERQVAEEGEVGVQEVQVLFLLELGQQVVVALRGRLREAVVLDLLQGGPLGSHSFLAQLHRQAKEHDSLLLQE